MRKALCVISVLLLAGAVRGGEQDLPRKEAYRALREGRFRIAVQLLEQLLNHRDYEDGRDEARVG